MGARTRSLAVSGLLTLIAVPISAQSAGVELGADIGIGVTFAGGSTVFSATTPTSLRIGIPVGSKLSFEPRINLIFAAGEGDTFTSLNLTPAFLIGLGGEQRSGPYVALLPVLALQSGFGSTETQFGAGAGIGTRLQQTGNFGFRIEGQFVHAFENDDFVGTNDVRALIGFSVFTH